MDVWKLSESPMMEEEESIDEVYQTRSREINSLGLGVAGVEAIKKNLVHVENSCSLKIGGMLEVVAKPNLALKVVDGDGNVVPAWMNKDIGGRLDETDVAQRVVVGRREGVSDGLTLDGPIEEGPIEIREEGFERQVESEEMDSEEEEFRVFESARKNKRRNGKKKGVKSIFEIQKKEWEEHKRKKQEKKKGKRGRRAWGERSPVRGEDTGKIVNDSLLDGDFRNRSAINKEQAIEMWEVAKRVGLEASNEEAEVIERITKLQSNRNY